MRKRSPNIRTFLTGHHGHSQWAWPWWPWYSIQTGFSYTYFCAFFVCMATLGTYGRVEGSGGVGIGWHWYRICDDLLTSGELGAMKFRLLLFLRHNISFDRMKSTCNGQSKANVPWRRLATNTMPMRCVSCAFPSSTWKRVVSLQHSTSISGIGMLTARIDPFGCVLCVNYCRRYSAAHSHRRYSPAIKIATQTISKYRESDREGEGARAHTHTLSRYSLSQQ